MREGPATGSGPALGPFETIRARADFLRANSGIRIVTPAFILLVHPSGRDCARVGFTVSRKVGGAVARNRAKRRLREVARLAMRTGPVLPADHVFIARPMEAERPFAALLRDAEGALRRAAARHMGAA
jgi:ribonuclease P protein component